MNKKSGSKFKTYLRPRAGFTLLEILIAIFIFAIIITTVYGTFNAVISKTEAITGSVETFEMARTTLNRIIADLSAIYVELRPLYEPPDFNDPPDPYRFVGKEIYAGTKTFSHLRFASFEHLPISKKDEKGIAEIVYYVKEKPYPESGYLLKRSDTVNPDDLEYEFEEKESDPILCESIEALSFTFFDNEGNEYEQWDSDSDFYKYATPHAIGIDIKINHNSEIHAFHTKLNLAVYREKLEEN